MDYVRLAEIIQQTFKNALTKPVYNFGLPKPYKGQSDKIATGGLRDSIEAIPTSEGIYVFMNDYGKWVQSGRMPGKYVPIKPLENWIRTRGINFKDKKGKSLTVKQMAYAISNHIHQWGIPSDPSWMDEAILELEKNKEVEQILTDMTVDELIEKIEGL